MSSVATPGGSVRELRVALLRHKGKSLLFFVVVVAAVATVTLLLPKEYRSTAKLFVRLGRENAMLDAAATLGQSPIVAIPQSRENEINSVVEIMQSRALLEKVVDRLGPAAILTPAGETWSAAESRRGADGPANRDGATQPGKAESPSRAAGKDEKSGLRAKAKPSWAGLAQLHINEICAEGASLLANLSSSAGLSDRERAILQLAKKIKVEAAKRSNVVDVSCEGPTPEKCQAVVTKLIDAFLDEHLRLNRTSGSHEFFVAQTRRLKDDLTRKERDLRDLKDRTGLASPAAQRQLIVARLGRLQDELLQAETARAVAQAKVQKLREKLASLPNTQVTNETSGFTNEGTDLMREQFFALQVREKEAQAKFTNAHPKMQQMREQVATARAVLDAEERNRKLVTKEPARLYQQAESTLLNDEPALASLQAQAEQLHKQLLGAAGIGDAQRARNAARRAAARGGFAGDGLPQVLGQHGASANRSAIGGRAHIERGRGAAGQLRAAADSSAEDGEFTVGARRGTVRRLGLAVGGGAIRWPPGAAARRGAERAAAGHASSRHSAKTQATGRRREKLGRSSWNVDSV